MINDNEIINVKEKSKTAILSLQEAGCRLSRDMAKSADERHKNIIEALNNAQYPPLIAITLDMVINSAKTEAIKEFAERMKEKAPNITEERFHILRNEIDNLVKEMVGDE